MSKEKLDIKILAKKMELLDIRVKELEEMNIKQFIHRLESLPFLKHVSFLNCHSLNFTS